MGSTNWTQGVILEEGRRGGGGKERRGIWERGMEGGVYPVVIEVREEWCQYLETLYSYVKLKIMNCIRKKSTSLCCVQVLPPETFQVCITFSCLCVRHFIIS